MVEYFCAVLFKTSKLSVMKQFNKAERISGIVFMAKMVVMFIP
jgi:hypothetical protein